MVIAQLSLDVLEELFDLLVLPLSQLFVLILEAGKLVADEFPNLFVYTDCIRQEIFSSISKRKVILNGINSVSTILDRRSRIKALLSVFFNVSGFPRGLRADSLRQVEMIEVLAKVVSSDDDLAEFGGE